MSVKTELPPWLKAGARIRLVKMGEDPDPIPPGATGTVTEIVSSALCSGVQLWVEWDPEVQRSLALVWPADEIEPLEESDG